MLKDNISQDYANWQDVKTRVNALVDKVEGATKFSDLENMELIQKKNNSMEFIGYFDRYNSYLSIKKEGTKIHLYTGSASSTRRCVIDTETLTITSDSSTYISSEYETLQALTDEDVIIPTGDGQPSRVGKYAFDYNNVKFQVTRFYEGTRFYIFRVY